MQRRQVDSTPARQTAASARRQALTRYGILDTGHEEVFDAIVQAAAKTCSTPIALISFVDVNRQWFKSAIGVPFRETDLERSICAKAIEHEGVFVVPNAEEDPRVCGNPLVIGDPGIRFYAGAPLVTPEGIPVGMICVLDTQPRQGVTDAQRAHLERLASSVVDLLERRCASAPSGQPKPSAAS